METVILVIMILVGFNFVLKLTCHNIAGVLITSAAVALFTGLTWRLAIEQSMTQIADWLADPSLMLDISVIMTIDVALQMGFCILSAQRLYNGKMSRTMSVIRSILLWIPGLLIFPVLFSLLVYAIFSFPGSDFATVALLTAAGVFVAFPLLSFGIRKLFPEPDLRLELMFMINALIAILGVVSTVNGRTAVKGTSEVEWTALAGVMALLAAGAAAGYAIYKYKSKNNKL